MRLISYRKDGNDGFGAVLDDDGIVALGERMAVPDLAALIEQQRVPEAEAIASRTAADFALSDIAYRPPITHPGKIVCIGVNYGDRNAEYKDGSSAPRYPSVFMRTRESLVGHLEPIINPPESDQLDYEGEIVLVIGTRGRRIPQERAWDHVAGLTLMNEGSVRDWLRHAKFNVTQGKNFERSGSCGPWMVTRDEIADRTNLHLTTDVNDERRQDDNTSNLIFPFDYLISYLSSFMPLAPGDIIATGTPTGAGARFDPPKYLRDGDRVTVHVAEIGTLSNQVVDEIVD